MASVKFAKEIQLTDESVSDDNGVLILVQLSPLCRTSHTMLYNQRIQFSYILMCFPS